MNQRRMKNLRSSGPGQGLMGSVSSPPLWLTALLILRAVEASTFIYTVVGEDS